MLRVNNLSNKGFEVDPYLSSRYLAIDFRNGLTDIHGKTVTLRGGGESLGATGLVLPGTTNNGVNISMGGSYTDYPWNFGSGAHTIEFILAFDQTGGSLQMLAFVNNFFPNAGWYIYATNGSPDTIVFGRSTTGSDFQDYPGNTPNLVSALTKIHLCWQRKSVAEGGACAFYINGVYTSGQGSSVAVNKTNQPLILGCQGSTGGTTPMKGYIESIRCYTNFRYPLANLTDSFTPPSSLLI